MLFSQNLGLNKLLHKPQEHLLIACCSPIKAQSLYSNKGQCDISYCHIAVVRLYLCLLWVSGVAHIAFIFVIHNMSGCSMLPINPKPLITSILSFSGPLRNFQDFDASCAKLVSFEGAYLTESRHRWHSRS